MINDESKYKVEYHVDKKGNRTLFCSLLSCFEQICYFEYRRVSDFNPWIFFCDDINVLYRDEMNVNSTGIKYRYMDVQEIDIKENYFCEISKLIAENGAIALRTKFNCVREYSWWGDESVSGHIAYIIGEDTENYYVVDNPNNLTNLEKIRMEANPSIVLIPKTHFQEAFENKCTAVRIIFHGVPTSTKDYLPYIREVVKKIVKAYYMRLRGNGWYIGREALQHMLQDCEKHYERMFDLFHNYELAVSRRLIFKRCLNICADGIADRMEIMKYLNQSIERWVEIKRLSDEWFFRGKEVSCIAKTKIEAVIEIEDKLMQQLEKVIIR